MKKASSAKKDELRAEYKRSDFGKMERGKYAAKLHENSNVVVLDPRVAELFPNAKAVNNALLSLAEVARQSARPQRASSRRSA
ncbi:MAG: hypothetical protein EXQ56_08855 [Acidobacteria bacterium]|nr:hypothetical protein [Acidobacteriota bacterium]